MALWTCLLPLLALLALWAPAPSQSENVHLCGEYLEDVVTIVCENRGFKNPKAPLELPDPQAGEAKGGAGGPKGLSLEELLEKSDIVDQCCINFCVISELETYCN